MKLSDFINKRLKELGRNRNWLINHGDLEWSTLSNIDKGIAILLPRNTETNLLD